MLRPQFSDREYNNDFATWCHHSLHDNRAAERLAVIDPADYADLEELRQELIEVIDERLDETELMLFARADQQFHFARSVIVVFDTYQRLADPAELVHVLPELSIGSIFYHFIDARRREPIGVDDFRAWLLGLGDPSTGSSVEPLAEVDPYFESLFVLREPSCRAVRRALRAGAAARRDPRPTGRSLRWPGTPNRACSTGTRSTPVRTPSSNSASWQDLWRA